MEKNVSAVLTAADLQAVISFLQQADAKLPFLITLTPEERIAITKMGPKSVDFVNDALETVNTFPDIMPSSFDKDEFTRDTQLVSALIKIKMYLDALQQKVDDTLLEVGSEAMVRALDVYSQVNIQQDKVPGLRSAFEKLRSRFMYKKNRKKEKNKEVRLE